jgi:hypothetical protein
MTMAHKFQVGDVVKSSGNLHYVYVVTRLHRNSVDLRVKDDPSLRFEKVAKRLLVKVEE